MNTMTMTIILTIIGIVSFSHGDTERSVALQNQSNTDDAQLQINAAFPNYDPSLGTLPAEQGWAESGFDGDDQIIDQVLFLNSNGPTVNALVTSVGFDWSVGFQLSMTTRVPTGTVAVPSFTPGYRGGASLSARDAVGREYSVLVGAQNLVFSSQTNFNPDPTLTIETPFDGASDFHTFTIIADADGATLHIDGLPRFHVPPGDIQVAGSPFIQWWADGRTHEVHSEWASVAFTSTATTTCIADLNGDGVLNFFDVSAFIDAYSAGCP